MSKPETARKKRAKRGKHGGSLELRGKTFMARWMVNGRRFAESTGETSKSKAIKWLERKLASVHTADRIKSSNKDEATIRAQQANLLRGALASIDEDRENASANFPALRLVDAFDTFLAQPVKHERTESTISGYRVAVSRLLGWLGEHHPEAVELRDVNDEIAREYAAYLHTQLGASSYNLEIFKLLQVWKDTDRQRKLHAKLNPWRCGRENGRRNEEEKNIILREEGDSVREPLTTEELARVAKQLKGDHFITFIVGVFTGLRLSDAATLKWRDVDFVHGEISVIPKKTRRFGKRVFIPMAAELRAVLASIPDEKRVGFVTPETAYEYETNRVRLSRFYVAAFKACGIRTIAKDGDKRGRNVAGFHALRHTFVSIAANVGIPFMIVQQIVGHSTAAMSARYFHENREANRIAFQSFPTLLGGEPAKYLPCDGDVIDVECTSVPALDERTRNVLASFTAEQMEFIKALTPEMLKAIQGAV